MSLTPRRKRAPTRGAGADQIWHALHHLVEEGWKARSEIPRCLLGRETPPVPPAGAGTIAPLVFYKMSWYSIFMIDQALLLEKTTHVLTGTYDFQKLAQQACDLIYKELKDEGLVGVGIIRVRQEMNEAYAYAYASKNKRLIDTLLPIPFSKMHLSLDYKDNLVVRTILSNQMLRTSKLSDCTKHVIPDAIVDRIQKILSMKSQVALPIPSKSGKVSGVILYDLNTEEASPAIVTVLQTFARQLGLSFSNVFAFERLANSYKKSLDARETTKDRENIPSIKFTLRISPKQLGTLEEQSRLKKKTKAEFIRDLLTTA